LILNELIQNAIEHGFQETLTGRISVAIEAQEGEVCLRVTNNGDRLPKDFSIEERRRLGASIVENLARSLGGKFTLADSAGSTLAELRFARTGGE
jgi:two-component sensor histidine kinase